MALQGTVVKRESVNGVLNSKEQLNTELEYQFRMPPGYSPVRSVNGMTGDVTLTAGDIEFNHESFSAHSVENALKELMSGKATVYTNIYTQITPTAVKTKIQNGNNIALRATIIFGGTSYQCVFSSWSDCPMVVASSEIFPLNGSLCCAYLVGITNASAGTLDTWTMGLDFLISDAPSDDGIYGRKNNSWITIPTVEGVVHLDGEETITGAKTFAAPTTLEENLILTSGVHYGTVLPEAGHAGRIFFLKV